MQRITMGDLEAVVERINHVTGSPKESYIKDKAGNYLAQPGNYHLDGAYGGWGLSRMSNPGGGVGNIIGGFMPKRELYEKMQAFLRGVEAGREEVTA